MPALLTQPVLRALGALAAGAVFGLGLAVAQMTDPRKVLGFLDVAGAWDASLLFVMGGAVVVAAAGFRAVLRRPAPRWDTQDEAAKLRIPMSAGGRAWRGYFPTGGELTSNRPDWSATQSASRSLKECSRANQLRAVPARASRIRPDQVEGPLAGRGRHRPSLAAGRRADPSSSVPSAGAGLGASVAGAARSRLI